MPDPWMIISLILMALMSALLVWLICLRGRVADLERRLQNLDAQLWLTMQNTNRLSGQMDMIRHPAPRHFASRFDDAKH